MKKHLSIIIITFSLIFLAYYLWHKSLLNFSIFHFNTYFVLSLLFLFTGFVVSGLSWWYALKIHDVSVSVKFGISSHGLPIFAKYIPGKIWTILGRASKVSDNSDYTTTALSFISLKEQLVYLLVGLIISLLPIYLIYGFSLFLLFVFLSGLGLFLIVFNKHIHRFINFILAKFIKKKTDLPLISIKNGFKLSWFNTLLWLMWTFGFYFFAKSVSHAFSIDMAFVFPVSVVYGVLAIIMPGGIGVRESIIAAYLTLSGMELEIATTISVASRLWFIIGEFFIFILSLILSQTKEQT